MFVYKLTRTYIFFEPFEGPLQTTLHVMPEFLSVYFLSARNSSTVDIPQRFSFDTVTLSST